MACSPSDLQLSICLQAGVDPSLPDPMSRLGWSPTAVSGAVPLNGLRHPASGGASGWYIWGGEVLSDDDDFFDPLCFEHLGDRCPEVLPFLALPPGWRFLLAPGEQDIWFDASLLVVGDERSN